MSSRRNALGRGIGALLPGAPPAAAVGPAPQPGGAAPAEIPIGSIDPNPEQPRRSFEVEEIDRLADSIRRRGVLQRDKYTCIYCGAKPGDRRRGRVLTKNEFTVEHVIPRCRDGVDTWGNTACACRWCNHADRFFGGTTQDRVRGSEKNLCAPALRDPGRRG